jgi:hypothetical protein
MMFYDRVREITDGRFPNLDQETRSRLHNTNDVELYYNLMNVSDTPCPVKFI